MFTRTLSISVEVDLRSAVSVSISHKPEVTPSNAAFTLLSDVEEVVVWCSIMYGDGDSSAEMFVLRRMPLVHVHTYFTDEPDVLFSVFCRNHFSNISTKETIILREEIHGLAISPISDYNVQWNTVIFNITLQSGSHVSYSVDFGDHSADNYTDPQRLSSISPYLVRHVYVDYGDYLIRVYAWNEHFNESLSLPLTIHWLCDVPQIKMDSQYTNVNSPLQIIKSKPVIIEPEIVINCSSSAYYNTSWTISTSKHEDLFTIDNVDSLSLKPKTLDYGVYIVVFSVSMFSDKPLPAGDEKLQTLTMYLEITRSPLKVSIEHGKEYGCKYNSSCVVEAESVTFDPDVDDPEDKSGMRFRWFCRRIDEEFHYLANGQVSLEPYSPPAGSVKHPYFGYGGCFKEGPGIIATSGGSYSFNSADMVGMTKYVFRVEVFKDVRWGFFEQEFYVGPTDPPQASIVCLQNCKAKTSIFTEKILKAVCETKCGEGNESLNVVWQLYRIEDDGVEVEVLDLANKTSTGISKPKLFLNLSTLVQGEWYTIVALTSTPGSPNSTSSLTFLLNKLASSGTCSIEPRTGIVTETKFVASCAGWKEWNPLLPGNTLRYEYRVKVYGADASFLFYYGTNGTSMPVDLPLGRRENSMTNLIEFAIIDGINDPVIVEQNITVLSTEESFLEISSSLLSKLTDLESLIRVSNETSFFIECLSYLYSVSSMANVPVSDVLDSMSNTTQQIKTIKTKTREKVLFMLQMIPLNSPSSMNQLNGVLQSVISVREELNVNCLDSAMNTLSHVTSSFVAFTASQALGAAAKTYAHGIVDSVIRVMETGASIDDPLVHDDISENTTTDSQAVNQSKGKLKDVMRQGMNNIEITANSMNNLIEMGDPAPVFTLNNVTLLLGKHDVNKINGSIVSTPQGQLKYPQEIVLSDTNPCAAQKVLFLGFNPYIWGSEKNRSHVGSSVLSLDINSCSNEVINKTRNKRSLSAKDSEEHQLSVELNIAGSQAECFNSTTRSKDEMIYHVYNIANARALKVSLQLTENASRSIDVYIKHGSKPGLEDYEFKSSLLISQNGVSNDSQILQYVSVASLTNSTPGLSDELYIGLLVTDQGLPCDDSLCDSFLLEYCISVDVVSCEMWDDANAVWLNDACKVSELAMEKVTFKSNLFGNFGAGLFVPPNIIDFSTVFDDFGSKIIENLPVFLTVVTVIVLYIPLVVLCRTLDKKDKLRWQCLPLIDNYPEDQFIYELHVMTGFKKNASCQSKVNFILYGSENDTGIRKLSDGVRKNFTRGCVSSFNMLTPWSLGEPLALKIWLDNSDECRLPAWYLSKVVVIDNQTKKWYLFTCNTWLGGINPTECTFKVDTDNCSNNNLLHTNITRKIFEDHIWLSVVYRLSWSSFTRVQRLSCCLAILFLTMVMNAMWYKTAEGGSSSTVIHIGVISFSLHELYTSTVSSLIIIPPIILITTLFAKSLPPANEMESSKLVLARGVRKLPHWCQYIAWILTIASIATGAFFTILYSFQFGGVKSKKWLIAFLLGFFESVFLIQPAKVVMISLLLSFIMKKDSDVADFEEQLGKRERPATEMADINPEAFMPSNTLSGIENRQKQEMEKKARTMLKELGYYTIFIFFLACVIYTNQDRYTYLQNENVVNTFLPGLKQVRTRESFWIWAEDCVVPDLYLTHHYNNQSVSVYEQRFMSDMYSVRMGPPRFRQVRKRSEVCPEQLPREISKMACISSYSIMSEDRTSYSLGWHPLANYTGNDSVNASFRYRSSHELNGSSYWGIRHYYSGGGYVASLGNTKSEASALLSNLKKYEWLDEYTAAIFLEFSVYNANSGLFNTVTLVLEFVAGTSVTTHATIDSVQLYRYNGAYGVFSLLTEISCLIFIIVITAMEIRRVIREKQRYFSSRWNWLQLTAIVFFLIAMSMYAIRSVMTQKLITIMMNNRESITNFQTVTMFNGYFLLFLGGVSFLVHLQLLRVLRYIKSIALLTTTLIASVKDMLGLGYATVLLLLSFTAAMAQCFREVEGYETFSVALGSGLSSVMQKFDFYTVTQATGLAGGSFLLIFVTTTKILVMNFFICMLNETLSAVKAEREKWAKDTEVIDYLKRVVVAMIKGDHSPPPQKPVYIEEDVECDVDALLDRIDILEQLVLAYDGPPRAAIAADLVDYFLKFEEEEANLVSLDEFSSLNSDDTTEVHMEKNIPVNDAYLKQAQRIVDAFSELFVKK